MRMPPLFRQGSHTTDVSRRECLQLIGLGALSACSPAASWPSLCFECGLLGNDPLFDLPDLIDEPFLNNSREAIQRRQRDRVR